MMLILAVTLLTGALAGFLAGLLGVGGGLIIVPALVWLYEGAGFAPQHVMHLALGTSLASIIFTSISSMRSHHGHGNVLWRVVGGISPGIVVGTLLGSLVAAQVPSLLLKWFFVVFALVVSGQMWSGFRPAAARQLPGFAGLFSAGGGIGAVSSWVGIGGGSLTVPFLSYCGVDVKKAIGTSAAVGFPIALAGAIGYVGGGWRVSALPEGSAGFVHLPSLIGIVAASVLMAPVGARLAQALPVSALKRAFSLLLLLMAGKMLWSLFA